MSLKTIPNAIKRRRTQSKICIIAYSVIRLIILLSALTYRVEAQSKNVLRINFGVNFKFVKNIFPTSGIWRHTFAFPLPNSVLGKSHHSLVISENAPNRLNETNWMNDCLLNHDKSLFGNREIHQSIKNSSILSLNESVCFRYSKLIKQGLKNIKYYHEEISDLLTEIYDMLPLEIDVDTKKRAWLPFVGRASSTIFGTVSEDQLQAVEDNVFKLAKIMETETANFKRTISDMVSFSRQTDKRLDLLAETVERNALNNVRMITETVGELDERLNFKVDFIRRMADIRFASVGLELYLNSYLTAVYQLHDNHLPSFFVTAKMLKSLIRSINKNNSRFKVVHIHPVYYYMHGHFVFYKLKKHLMVTLDIPLTNFETSFNIFEITKFEQIVPNHENSSTMLLDTTEAIAIQQNQHLFYLLDKFDLHELHITGGLKSQHRILRKFSSKICIVAIFLDEISSVKEHCKFEITVNKVQSQLIPVTATQFIANNIGQYELLCVNHTKLIKTCPTQCVISVPLNCDLSNNDYQITQLYSSKTKEIAKNLYPVNKPYLSHFFEPEVLSEIRGDTLFESEMTVTLPKFEWFDNPHKDLIAQDNAMKLDLKKSISALQADKTILDSMSDVIVLDKQQFDKSWNSWTDYIIIGLTVLCILMLLQLAYCTVRIRALTLALTVLQGRVRVTDAKFHILNITQYKLKYESQKTTPNTASFVITEQITDNVEYITFVLTLGFFAIMLGKFLYSLWRRCNLTKRIATTISLHIFTTKESMLMPLQTIPGFQRNLGLQLFRSLSNFELTGFLRPQLQFKAKGHFKNNLTGKANKLISKLRVTWMQKIRLQKILSQEFQVELIGNEINGPFQTIEIQQISTETKHKELGNLQKSKSCITLT